MITTVLTSVGSPAATPCAVVDISNATTTLHAAQEQARAASASAPCVTVRLGQRSFRLTEPLVLSAADSHTSWHGGEITSAVDVPPSAWKRADGIISLLDVAPLVNRSEWGGFARDGKGAHLSLLVEVHGIWRPMTVARWPNVPFNYGDVPPVNWTTISATCECPGAPAGGCDKADPPASCGVGCDWFSWANDTERPLRWVDAAREGRLFVHGFFKYMWSDHFAAIASVDVATRRMRSNTSIGGTYGITNDSYYYAYGMREELDAEGEFVLNETSGELAAVLPAECLDADGHVACPTRLVPASKMARMECCVAGNCSLPAMVRVVGATNVSFRGVSIRGSAGAGVGVFGSENVTLDSCTLDNHQVGLVVGGASSTRPCGGSAHPSVGSSGVQLLRSRVGFTGMAGASLTGGNRTTLTRARFLVESCRFHDFGRRVYTYQPGVEAHGVGVVVRRSEFRSSYHVALHYSGNDHLIELNAFHHVTSIGYDSGAVYAGRDLSSRGTVIRHNLFHHLDEPAPCNGYSSCFRCGVYIDDLEGGVTLDGNIFYRVPRAFESNCGGDFSIANNLFVETQVAVHQAGRAQPTGATAAALYAELDQVPFRGALWQSHYYPQLARYKNWTVADEPPAGCLDGPIGNRLATNVVVNFTPPFYWGESECRSTAGYYHGDVQHRKWLPGFCDSRRSPGGVCADAPNAARMFTLAAPWTNSTAHFDVQPSNAIVPDPQFVSTNLERDLNFAIKPTSPLFALGWKAIPQRDIGPAGTPSIRLRNAAAAVVLMPATGLGTGCNIGGCTWSTPGADMRAYNMTLQWLGIGGRRVDDADSYGLAQGIGKALRDSGVARSEAFLVSKTGPGGLPYPLGYNETIEQGRQIVANYSTPYVDLLLVHWPTNYGPCSYHGPKPSIPTTDPLCDTSLATYSESGCRLSSWRAMLSLLDAGLARAVGVSNFNSSHLEEIRRSGLRMPAVNQVSFSPQHGPGFGGCSPGWQTETCGELLAYCRAHGIVLNGYSPFGGAGGAAKLLSDPRLTQMASRLGTTPSKVVLAWQWAAHGVPVNPEATALEYQTENLEFFDVELDASDVAVLDSWASLTAPALAKVKHDPMATAKLVGGAFLKQSAPPTMTAHGDYRCPQVNGRRCGMMDWGYGCGADLRCHVRECRCVRLCRLASAARRVLGRVPADEGLSRLRPRPPKCLAPL